jgi:hypothetical protein
MPGTAWGQGRRRRDDVQNRLMDMIYKGNPVPMGWNHDPNVMMAFANASLMQTATIIDLVNQNGSHLIRCGASKAGGTDVCG